MDDLGFSEDTRQSSKVTGNICKVVKGRRTVTGACGPYNLGDSAIEWYQSDRNKVFVVLFYKTSKCFGTNLFNLLIWSKLLLTYLNSFSPFLI